VLLVLKENLVHRDHKASKGFKELKVHKDLKV
jgi:hypothetical protein